MISFTDNIGTGSARSIDKIDLGKIILKAKQKKILINGGGHAMAAGLKITFSNLSKFKLYLDNYFSKYNQKLFERVDYFDSIISINDLNNELIRGIEKLQPFGKGNPEPTFILVDGIIESIKIIKNKHYLIFFNNIFGKQIKAICFNSKETILGDYLEKFNHYKFSFACNVTIDKFVAEPVPQLIIRDIMKID